MADDSLREELDKLRNWRHDVASPILWAVKSLLDDDPGLSSLGGRIQTLHGRVEAMERQLREIDAKLERLARADEIAQALRDNLWTIWQKLGAFTVAFVATAAAVASLALQIFH